MKERFTKLIFEFCSAISLSQPGKMIEGAPFTINGVAFSIAHRPGIDENLIFIYADFGSIPSEKEVETYYQLLRENFFEFPIINSSFSISSSTERIVYASAYHLDKYKVDDLIVTLTAITCRAKRWRLDRANSALQSLPVERKRLTATLLPIKRHREESPAPLALNDSNVDH